MSAPLWKSLVTKEKKMENRQNWILVRECNLQMPLKKCQDENEGLNKQQGEGNMVEEASGHGAHLKS